MNAPDQRSDKSRPRPGTVSQIAARTAVFGTVPKVDFGLSSVSQIAARTAVFGTVPKVDCGLGSVTQELSRIAAKGTVFGAVPRGDLDAVDRALEQLLARNGEQGTVDEQLMGFDSARELGDLWRAQPESVRFAVAAYVCVLGCGMGATLWLTYPELAAHVLAAIAIWQMCYGVSARIATRSRSE